MKRFELPVYLAFASIWSIASAEIDLGWQPVATPELPSSIQLFESTSPLPGGDPIRAVYAEVDLSDPNIELKARTVGSNNQRVTPLEWIETREEEPTFVATNGGFFSGTDSVSIIGSDGVLLESGLTGVATDAGTAFPTRGAFAVLENGLLDVAYAWPQDSGNTGEILAFPEPSPLPADVAPTLTSPADGELWDFREVMGGLITLVDDGAITTDADWRAEYISSNPRENAYQSFIGINPRTLVAYTPDQKMILMVIEGGSETSRGTTIQETAEIVDFLNVEEALNLDGGGSSVLVTNDSDVRTEPSDLAGIRPVASFMVVKRVPQIVDTDDATGFSRTSGWFPTSNAGFFGDSETLLIGTVAPDAQPTASATYTFPDLPPARYALSGWWVGAGNRSSNTPFTISRPGFEDVVVNVDQTGNTGTFNSIGEFHLSGQDQITISNNATGDFVAADAIELKWVGPSEIDIAFDTGSETQVVPGGELAVAGTLSSPNSAVTVEELRIFKSVNGGAESLVVEELISDSPLEVVYNFNETVGDPADSVVTYRWEVTDDRGVVQSETLLVKVKPFDISIPAISEERASGREICFDVALDTVVAGSTFTDMTIYKSIDGGDEEVFDVIPLNSQVANHEFCYTVAEVAGSEIRFRFEAETSAGVVGDVSYTASVVPARGDLTFGFVSDMNGSFGSTTYAPHVRDAFGFLIQQNVDAVFSAGDMIAGQSSALDRTQVEAMWAGFRNELYSQLQSSNVPFLFTLGNHDAALPLDREVAEDFWKDPSNTITQPGLAFFDGSNYPFTYATTFDIEQDGVIDIFFVALDGADGSDVSAGELAAADAWLASPEAQNASLRIVGLMQPLYAISNERNSSGFISGPRPELTEILRERNVSVFFSGDSAAYFPGKRNGVRLLSLGEMSGKGKPYIGESQIPPTAVTRMDYFSDDPFFGKDAVVFTTYDILNGNRIVKNTSLPTALVGFDQGFVIRDDLETSETGATTLSPLALNPPVLSTNATGSATVEIIGETVQIDGSFADLSGPLVAESDAVALYFGRHASDEAIKVADLPVNTADGLSGSFSGSIPLPADFRDGLAVGLYFIEVKTSAHPNGEIRGQLFNAFNSSPPAAPVFSNVNENSSIGLKDIPGLFVVEWSAAADVERTPQSYIYQVATDRAFSNLIINQGTGRATSFRELTQREWRSFLGSSPDNEVVSLYHRVIASDGQNTAVGEIQELNVFKDPTPPEGAVEVPAPQYQFDGIIGATPGFHNYDVTKDETTGRIWANSFSGGVLRIWNPDGTDYELTHPAVNFSNSTGLVSITFEGVTYTDFSPIYGVEWHPDGYVIIAANGDIWKLDAETGEPLALWEGAGGSNPSISTDGKVFHHSVFPSRDAWLLRQNGTTFDVVSPPDLKDTLADGSNVVRTSGMSPEGDAIYLPNAGAGRNVGIFFSDNGVDFTYQGDFEMPAATGSNAVVGGPDRSMYVINNKSDFPPRLIFSDFNESTFDVSWQMLLSNELSTDVRSFHVTSDASELYVGDSSDRIFKYSLLPEGFDAVKAGNLPTPELNVDTTDVAVGNSFTFTFEETDPGSLADDEQAGVPDTEAWRSQVAMITVNSVPINLSLVTIEPGAFTLDGALFPSPGFYEIVVSAPNHFPARVVQRIREAPPQLVLDTQAPTTLDDIEFTFSEVAGWRDSVDSISVNGEPISEDRYSLTAGRLIIDSSEFPLAGLYTVTASSPGFEDSFVDVTIGRPSYADYVQAFLADLSTEDQLPGADPDNDNIPNEIEWLWALDGLVPDANGARYTRVTADVVEIAGENRLQVSMIWPSDVPHLGSSTFRVLTSETLDADSFVEAPRSEYLVYATPVSGNIQMLTIQFLQPAGDRQFAKIEWILDTAD